MIFFTLGLSLLFFLPVIESFDRNLAFNLLMIGSLLLAFSTFWKKKIIFDFIELLWLLMLLTFTLSTTLSWSISRSYPELLRYFAYFLIFVSVRRFPDIQSLIKRFFIPMVIVNTLILSIVAIAYFLPFFRLTPPTEGMNLFYPVFGHNHLSDILLFTLPIVISFISSRLRSNNNILYYIYCIGTIFFTIVFILTMARGAMLSLVFALFIYFFFVNRDKHWNPWIFLISSITVIFLLTSFVFSNFLVSPEKGKLYPKFIYKNAAAEARPIYFGQALDNFLANPVFGTGLDTFRYVSRMKQTPSGGWSWYVHNHFLQIFTETGFLGGVLFLILITTLLFCAYSSSDPPQLRRCWRGVEKPAPSTTEGFSTRRVPYGNPSSSNNNFHGLFIAVLASSIHSLIDFDWQFISIFLIFWSAVALLTPIKNIEKKATNFVGWILILVIFIFYSLQFIIPLNAEKLIAKGDKVSLQEAYRLDTKNIDIAKKLAQTEADEQNFNKAHYWYRTAIFLAPYESYNPIKQDALLYLAQIKKAASDKNINLSLAYLKTLGETYPFYFQISSGEYYLVNAYRMNNLKDKAKALVFLKEYVNSAQRKISGYKLSPSELQSIIDK